MSDTPRTSIAVYNGHRYLCNKCAALEIENRKLRKLLAAVVCHEFGGVECKSVNGKAWWDERDAMLREGQQ